MQKKNNPTIIEEAKNPKDLDNSKVRTFKITSSPGIISKLIASAALVLAFFGASLNLVNIEKELLIDYIRNNYPDIISAVGIAIFSFIFLVDFAYPIIKRTIFLKSERSFYSSPQYANLSNNFIVNEIAELNQKFNELRANNAISVLSEEDINKAKEQAINDMASNITSEAYKKIQDKAILDQIESLKNRSLARLSDVSVVLGYRANLTLVMGVIFCSMGLIAIYASFFISPPAVRSSEDNVWFEMIRSYAPRFTMVIIIEIIGFFFLKLYKSTLSEIRYVHNEITNIEMKLVALYSTSTIKSDHAPMILQSLVNTERNSVIDKNQTTVEIEQNRAQADADRSTLEALVSLLHGNEKGSFWRRGS